MKDKIVTLKEEHIEAISNLKERPGGFNFSQWVRKKLEEDFAEEFNQ
ncbi:hypothetical protein [Candidatus Nanohalovita haloferacivicina]|nr:hypothetical protein HBNXNv_0348 [Candidatus Nanohalobia archaeon BNXNv]